MMTSGKGDDQLDWDARDEDMYERLASMTVWFTTRAAEGKIADMVPRDNVVVILKNMARARRAYRVEQAEKKAPSQLGFEEPETDA